MYMHEHVHVLIQMQLCTDVSFHVCLRSRSRSEPKSAIEMLCFPKHALAV